MAESSLTLQSVLRRHYAGFRRTRRVRRDVQHAAESIVRCRSAALGGHVKRCECGHVARVEYNSCRHRSCAECRGGRRAEWLAEMSEKLLPCDHVHVIFTVPDSLNIIWQFNRERFAELLLCAARESLLELLGDPEYLGAQPGIISVLHTWGSNLSVHPHVHCIVTAGGVDASGRFIDQERSTLLPARVLMAVFRGKFCAFLRRVADSHTLNLAPSLRLAQFRSLLNRLGRLDWNVRIKERHSRAVCVAGYLARYITGGPISNGRLHSCDDKTVTFWYKDYRDGRRKLLPLAVDDFLQRWSEHVPPHASRLIRRSGLYANCHAKLCRTLKQEILARDPDRRVESIPALEPERCPLCNTKVIRRDIRRNTEPARPTKRRLERTAPIQPP